MDEATSREIIKVPIGFIALFDQMMETLQTKLPLQDYEIQKLRIAGVMGKISAKLLTPIYKSQPSDEPC